MWAVVFLLLAWLLSFFTLKSFLRPLHNRTHNNRLAHTDPLLSSLTATAWSLDPFAVGITTPFTEISDRQRHAGERLLAG